MNPQYKAALKSFDVVPWLRDHDVRFTPMEGTDEIVLDCPKCDEDEPGGGTEKLWYNVQKKIGLCYKCESSYTADKVLQYVGGLSLPAAMALVLEQAKGAEAQAIHDFREKLLREDRAVDAAPVAVPEIDLPPEFIPYKRGLKHPSYFEERGITPAQAEFHKLGWCLRGRYRNRLVIPVYTLGKLVAFNTRLMLSASKIKETNKRLAEQLSPDEYRKKKLKPYKHEGRTKYAFFNYDRARTRSSVVLCEGVFDAIRVGPDAMALLGKSVGEYKYDLLSQTDAEEFVLMLDPDEAGVAATLKIGERLSNTVAVRVATLPEGKDPDEFPRSRLDRARKEAVPFSQWRDRRSLTLE